MRERIRRLTLPVAAAVVAAVVSGGAVAAAFQAAQPQALCPAGVPVVIYPGDPLTYGCGEPTPSETVTPTVQPTTPAPTTAAPTTAPPATTAPPSTTQPVATTSSPTPTGPVSCMSQPSACGWPDATNTGPTGPLTVRSSGLTISTAGAVVQNLDIRGCVTVLARNVTIRNSRITCSAPYAVSVRAGDPRVDNGWQAADANLLLEDVEIDFAGQRDGKMIAFSGYTARRVWFHGGSDCAHFGVNVTVEDSFCDIPAGGPTDGPHYDGLQSDGGRNIVIRHNTIRVPYSQTSAILMSTNTSPIADVAIVDNLVAGGGYSIYCGTDSGGAVRGTFTFGGNVVSRMFFPRGGYWGPTTSCPASGWRWDG